MKLRLRGKKVSKWQGLDSNPALWLQSPSTYPLSYFIILASAHRQGHLHVRGLPSTHCFGEMCLHGPCPLPSRDGPGIQIWPALVPFLLVNWVADLISMPRTHSLFWSLCLDFFGAIPRPSTEMAWMEMTHPTPSPGGDMWFRPGHSSTKTSWLVQEVTYDPNQASRANARILLKPVGSRIVFCPGVANRMCVCQKLPEKEADTGEQRPVLMTLCMLCQRQVHPWTFQWP